MTSAASYIFQTEPAVTRRTNPAARQVPKCRVGSGTRGPETTGHGKSPRRCEILGGTLLGLTQISNLPPLA